MKKGNVLCALSIAALLAFSCKNKPKVEEAATDTTTQTPTTATSTETPADNMTTSAAPATLDLNAIPVTDKLTGTFPYFKLPPGYHFTDPHSSSGGGKNKDYDKEYFINHGSYVPQEGKTFKAEIEHDEGKEFSKLELQRSFDDFIKSLNGVNINNGEKISSEEKARLEKADPNAYNDGYTYSCNNWDDIHTYVLRAKDKTVFVQVNYGGSEGYITILETKPFENKMSQTSAAVIQQEIDQNGKAVLHINFDVDKATLLPDGEKAVKEIQQVLNNNAQLKLSIQGHTDDTGNKVHNKQLSLDRANTVKNTLVSAGISGNRLTANGFGAERPIAANDTEENKAKNRRVELVKI
ncbi:MAG: OmpA family protein [Pseudopedobacter saltans]|uniref:OmpA family protein n=1 Tax=Pseudopedobacter saltans TaxID=151895 RepID=A0A2W5F6K5_9SPHI|nr:MAG: OmpA family protein [Pseudopedobacter saltans]